jgi:predicted dehydrogenase
MTTLQPVRVAIIGAGAIGTLGHGPNLKKLPGVSVVAICDSNGDRARAAAAQLGVERSYDDWREAVASDEVDAITVGVPNSLHAPITIGALEHGKHVLCEKPLAMNAQEGQQMVDLAQRQGKVLAVNLNNRLRPEIQLLKRGVENGRFGKVYYVNSRLIRRAGIPGFGSWFTRKDLAGGGALLDIGVHYLDMALYVAGFPAIAGVHGVVASQHGPQGRGLGGWGADRVAGGVFDVDDFASVTLRLAGGGVLKTEVTWAAFAPNEERFQLFGDKGGADLAPALYGNDTPLRYFGSDEGGDLDSIPAMPPRVNTYEASMAGFVDAIRGTGRPAATGAEALVVQKILDAVYRSAAEGREVTL